MKESKKKYYKMSDAQCESDSHSTSPKKIKISNETTNGVDSNSYKLKEFIIEKVLNNNTNRKTVFVLGKFAGKSGDAIVIFEKNAFKEENLNSSGFFSEESELRSYFQNDIYGNFECYPNKSINGIKTTIIHPATERHIAKYSSQEVHIIQETPELYNNYTLPEIERGQFDLQWVFNILEGKSEQDRIIYDNPCPTNGFILAPDLKWDGHTKEALYLLAIVRQKGLKSLRDLNGSHLELLKGIRDQGKKAIHDKYGVVGSQLRIYFHYQPSFYHLHIHFTYLKHEAPGIYAEKAHLLDTVISNLEIMPEYYKKATLSFVVREMDKLFNVYETNGLVRKVISDDSQILNVGDK